MNTHFLRQVMIKWDEVEAPERYPFSLVAVQKAEDILFHPHVTLIVGDNGSGKSTLLEGIAVAWGFNPEGGTMNFTFSSRSSHSELHRHLRLVKGVRRPRNGFFFRAESFYNLSTNIEELDSEGAGNRIIDSYGGRYLHDQSHGEAFFAVFMNRFGGQGLYILDEPEAALSPVRQMAMLSRLHQLVGQGCQFIITTHSPIIMAYPNATIFQLGEGGIEKVAYEETEHYISMREFMVNREKMLRILLGSAE